MCLTKPSYQGWEALDHMSWLVKIAIKWNQQLFMHIDENTELMDEQAYLNWCDYSQTMYKGLNELKQFTDYTDGMHKYIKKDMVKKFGEEKVEVMKEDYFNQEVSKSLDAYWKSKGLGEAWFEFILDKIDADLDHLEYYNGYIKWSLENPGHILSNQVAHKSLWIIKDKETGKLIKNPLTHLNYLA